jgi:hypothetical protein
MPSRGVVPASEQRMEWLLGIVLGYTFLLLLVGLLLTIRGLPGWLLASDPKKRQGVSKSDNR